VFVYGQGVHRDRRAEPAKRAMTGMDVHRGDDLAFPQSLPEFQRLFPDDAACAAYLERARWADGFVCPYCGVVDEPFRIATRLGVLQCRTYSGARSSCGCRSQIQSGAQKER
jgi:hypothetical protein